MPKSGRVQTPNLDGLRQAIIPQAQPVDTFVRPQEPPRGPNSLLQIADALSSVNAGLGNYAAKLRQDDKKAKDEAEDQTKLQAEVDAATLSGSEWSEKYQHLDPDKKKIYGAYDGMRQADLFTSDIASAYDAIEDKDNVDIVAWADDMRRKKAAQIDTLEGKAAFIKGSGPAFEAIINGHQKYLAGRNDQKRVEALGSQANLVIQQVKRQGGDKKLIQANLGEILSDAKKLAGLTPENADKVMYSLAQRYAEAGDVDVVDAILNAPRGGRGSLLSDTFYGAESYKVLESAYTSARQKKVEQTPIKKGEFDLAAQEGRLDPKQIEQSPFHSPEEKATLFRVNEAAKAAAVEKAEKERKLNEARTAYDVSKQDAARQMYSTVMSKGRMEFVDMDGVLNRDGTGVETYTAKQQKDDLIKYHEQETTLRAQQRLAKGEDPTKVAEDAMKEHLEFYSRIREPRDQWKQMLDGAAMSVSAALAAKGDVPESAKEAYTVYTTLMRNNPGLVDEMVKDKNTRLLFETYKTLSQSGQGNPTQWWYAANDIVQKSVEGKLPRVEFSDQDFDTQVGGQYQGEFRVEVKRYAELLAQTGTPKSAALKKAYDTLYDKSYKEVSGHMLYMGYKELPHGAVELLEDKLDDIAARFGTVRGNGQSVSLFDEGDDLFVGQMAGARDSWVVFSKDTNLPVLDDAGAPIVITLSELDRMNKNRADIERSRAKDKAYGRESNILWSTDNLLGMHVPFALGWNVRPGEFEAKYQELRRDNMIRDREAGGLPPNGNPSDYRAKGKKKVDGPGKDDNFGIPESTYKRAPTGAELLSGLLKKGDQSTAEYVARGMAAAPIVMAAKELGISPVDLATVISYETGGRFSTSIMGGKGGRYMGLIQFGPAERKMYGAHAGQSFDDQMKAVVRYLKDRGLKPGMGILDLYSTINAGRPGLYSRSDGKGATVASHVRDMLNSRHRARAKRMFGLKDHAKWKGLYFGNDDNSSTANTSRLNIPYSELGYLPVEGSQ